VISPSLEVIELDVFTEEGKVVDAKSKGNSLRGFEKAFRGKDASTLHEALPRMLATCSQSHVLAYTKPFQEDAGVSETLVKLEIIESHLRHPYAYWFPHLKLGDEYDFPSGEKFKRVSYYSRKVRELMERIGGKWPHLDYLTQRKKVRISREELKEIVAFVEGEVLGMGLNEFLEAKELEELNKGDVGKLVERAYSSLFWNNGLKNYLTVGFPFHSNFEKDKLEDRGLVVLYDGKPVEVGPLAQALTFDELVKKYHDKYGPSPLLREISRMKVMAKLLLSLYDVEFESKGFSIRSGHFLSAVESIRGSLIHSFSVDKMGKIVDYVILQPTTIISSPGGALERSVIGVPLEGIPLAVSSLDTCFVTKVNVYEGNRLLWSKRIGGFC